MTIKKNLSKILCSTVFCLALGVAGCSSSSSSDSSSAGSSGSASSSLAEDEFEVKFDSRGGTEVASQVVKIDQKAKKPDDPSSVGFVFEGWFLDYAGIHGVTPFDFETPITSDTVLYAGWTVDWDTVTGDSGSGGGGGGGTPTGTNVREITEKWSGTTYVYLWTGSGGEGNQNAPWPGVKLQGTPSSTGPGGNNYSIDLANYEKIIINNGSDSAKTSDTSVSTLLSTYATGLYVDTDMSIKGW